MNVLFIDNFDSFTYNLVDEFKRLGCNIKVYRNDISLEQLEKIVFGFQPMLIVLSPGPSRPKDSGICIPLIKKYYKSHPILGICLGHQCIIDAFGGLVSRALVPVHGKKSELTHAGTRIFLGVPSPFFAGRYHSLYGSRIPGSLKVTATAGKIPMAVEHSKHRVYGLQFHPESILTPDGSRIIKNILEELR